MPAPVNLYAASFLIRELGGDNRLIDLNGRALPLRPLELSGSQRATVEWYPGSPTATIQVFGAKEEPTTVRGRWCDKFLGEHLVTGSLPYASVDLQAVSTSRDLALVVDDVRRKGQEVEVQWMGNLRRGVVTRFTQRWQTGADLEWELQFDWSSQDEATVPALETRPVDLTDVPAEVQAQIDELGLDGAEAVPQSGDRFADAAARINRAAEDLQDASDSLQDTVVQAIRQVQAPIEAARRVVAVLDGIRVGAGQVVALLQDLADSASLNADLPLGETLRRRATLRAQSDEAVELRARAAERQARLARAVAPELVAAFVATEDMDLRAVSTRFYGASDEWRGLAQFNRLADSRLSAGQTVFVPATPPSGGC